MSDARGERGRASRRCSPPPPQRFGERLAIEDGPTGSPTPNWSRRPGTFAAALVASGIEPGDRVAIWAFNSAEWVVAMLGLFAGRRRAGPDQHPVQGRRGGRHPAPESGSGAGDGHRLPRDRLRRHAARPPASSSPTWTTIVVARGPAPDGAESWAGFLARATEAGRAVGRSAPRASWAPDDPSDILFTSGTTGQPKGVVMTHGRTLCVATDWVAMTGLRADDRYLMVNPYFHMFGLKAGILACVVAGATMLPEPVFDVDRVLDRVDREQVTVLPGPPTLYQAILDHPERGEPRPVQLRVAVTGAADIPVELVRRIADELPFSTIITGYGLTEAGTAAATSPGDDVETIATTVGRPRPGFEIRIADGDGAEVPPGEPGEVVLRGGSVMVDYLDDPEATAAGTLRRRVVADRRHRGDRRGRVPAHRRPGQGHVHRRRLQRLSRRDRERPAAPSRHPQAAVIGIPDDRLGEVGMAFVVTGRRRGSPAPMIIGWCRDQMANYKVPRAVEVVDELPINATGKVHEGRAAPAGRRRTAAGCTG